MIGSRFCIEKTSASEEAEVVTRTGLEPMLPP